MKEDDIFEEVARDISERTIGIEEDERNREYRNCLRVMAFPGNFLYLWRLFDRVMKLFPNIEYVIGTDLVEVESEIKTYKLTSVDAINNDVLSASYDSGRINFYVLFDFKPFLFSTYCNLLDFVNQLIDNFNTNIDLNFRNSSYSPFVTTISYEYSANDIRFLRYSTFKNEMKYLVDEYPFERFNELKWKHITNMLSDELLNDLEQKIIRHISDHKPSNSATISWVVLSEVLKEHWCKRLKTKCDDLKIIKKPINIDGYVSMQIKEEVMLEFCKTRELKIDAPSISSTIVIENSTCKRGSFFLTDDFLVCIMNVQENQKEVFWVYYGWQIKIKQPWFIFQKKLELTLRQCFGDFDYKNVYNSLIEELKNR